MAHAVGVTVRYDVWTDKKYAHEDMGFDWIGWTVFRTKESIPRCLPLSLIHISEPTRPY